jgi:hypothetical protein
VFIRHCHGKHIIRSFLAFRDTKASRGTVQTAREEKCADCGSCQPVLNFRTVRNSLWHFWYDTIRLSTAIGLPPGGSSTVHIYTQTIHRTIQNKQYIEQHKHFGKVRAVPGLCELYPGICLTTEEKARKNLRQDSRRVPAGTMTIHNHMIRMHRHNNKNT